MEDTSERKTNESRTRHLNEVPHIDAGSHVALENSGFRAVSNFPNITLTQQFHCDLPSLLYSSHLYPLRISTLSTSLPSSHLYSFHIPTRTISTFSTSLLSPRPYSLTSLLSHIPTFSTSLLSSHPGSLTSLLSPVSPHLYSGHYSLLISNLFASLMMNCCDDVLLW